MDNQGGRPTGLNQQIFQMPGGQTRSQNGLPTHPSDLTQADQQKVMELAQKLAASCPEPQKNHYRTLVQTRFAQRAQEDTAQGKDPVLIWFQHQAFQGLTKNIAMQRQQRQLKDNMPPNMNPQAQATMQASREQISPAMMETAIIPGANGNYGQFNTIESTNQQKVGILAQEQGQTVVSTSNDPALSASPHPVTKGQGQEMPMQEVHPHHNEIKQKQMATAMARLTNMRQTQELLLKLPSTFRLNTMSSSLSAHHTISKDFTGGEDARNASLFADLGARLNGCPQASSRNKPKM
ncbi:uncharacterized protein CTRU02_214599 [Colletotrichum truncatum]|uniref:Uncharacterized protein n=1 Tax=Colletotrichum truncatum TaxID=5467 RepID=A0ACC3YFA6_COLTU|nr:uncharacterized protein CTRU02_09546 [Colletotrichum truncatum]KAF6788228.1 hypothetical protein CTRU02_09546 [Colletotrichum truncatum]